MENASKALLMAGSVLLSVLIVGLLVLMFNGLSNVESSRTQTKEIEQASKVNETLEAYNRRLLYGTDIISICNLIFDYNERYGATNNPTEGYKEIEVEIHINKNIFYSDTDTSAKDLFDKVKNNIQDGNKLDDLTGIGKKSKSAKAIKEAIEVLENGSKSLAKKEAKSDVDGKNYQIAFLAQKDPRGLNLLMTGNDSSSTYSGPGAEYLECYKKTLDYLKDFKRKLFTCAPNRKVYSDGEGVEYDESNGSIEKMYFTELN